MKKKIISILIIAVLIIFALLLSKRQQINTTAQTSFEFDTVITIQIYEGGDAKKVLESCQKKCEYYESILSRTVVGSDVWNINHSNGQPVQVSEDTARLISESVKYCDLSKGALDITMAPVIEMWNFTDESTASATETKDEEAEAQNGLIAVYGRVPIAEELLSKLGYVNYKEIRVEVDPNNNMPIVSVSQGYGIDLGAVAKGYIADRLAEYMIDNGVTSAIINLGGNTLCIGEKPEKAFFSTKYVPFKVGIQKPFGVPGEVAQVVELGEGAGTYYNGVHIDSLVTSGTYQRYFEKDGTIYHHILSTENGLPVWNGLDSVSIHCGSSMEADALSTAVFCLGQEKGQELLDTLPEAEGIFISSIEQ